MTAVLEYLGHTVITGSWFLQYNLAVFIQPLKGHPTLTSACTFQASAHSV